MGEMFLQEAPPSSRSSLTDLSAMACMNTKEMSNLEGQPQKSRVQLKIT
jgi:hypothetical protein